MSFKLFNKDNLEVMDYMIKKGLTVDAVITDPPYEISKENNFSTMLNKYGKPAHRKGIDFGEWDKDFDQYTWIDKAISILKPGGSLFIFNDWKKIGMVALYAESKGMIIKDMFRWEKSNPMPRNRDRRYITDFETAIWLVKPKGKWTFNRQDDKYERPKFVGPLVSGNEKTDHPTQKSLELMEHIIKIHTNPNDVVVDPFMGSGTTGEACANLGRRFIGMEKDTEHGYFSIAKERIEKAYESKALADEEASIRKD